MIPPIGKQTGVRNLPQCAFAQAAARFQKTCPRPPRYTDRSVSVLVGAQVVRRALGAQMASTILEDLWYGHTRVDGQ